jgi:membrane protease YdiL (CAAX protease family)
MMEFFAELLWPWLFLGLANEVPAAPAALAFLRCAVLAALTVLLVRVSRLRERCGETGKVSIGHFRGWQRICLPVRFLAGAALGILLNLSLNLLLGGIRRYTGLEIAAHTLTVSSGVSGVLAVIRVLFLMPAAEEMVFRELGYGKLRGVMGAAPACAVTAVWFGLSHGADAGGIYAGILGIFLAMAREREGLSSACLLHAGANAGSLILCLLASGG